MDRLGIVARELEVVGGHLCVAVRNGICHGNATSSRITALSRVARTIRKRSDIGTTVGTCHALHWTHVDQTRTSGTLSTVGNHVRSFVFLVSLVSCLWRVLVVCFVAVSATPPIY